MLKATLLLLAGGESRRMGVAKARLPVGSSSLLEWQHHRLGAGFDEVLISTNEPAVAPAGVRVVADRLPGRGPLAGIEAGLAAARNDALVVVACDMPRVTATLLADLVLRSEGWDAAVPRVAGRPEPVCACYRRSALAAVSAALDGGRFRASSLLAGIRVCWLEAPDPDAFWSINTPEHYQVFRSSL